MASAPSRYQPAEQGGTSSLGGGKTISVSQRATLRIGAVGAVGGGTLTLVGNILHPREAGQLEDAESLLTVAAGSDLWVIDHFVILIAVSLLLAAFHGLARSFTAEPSATWARLAWGVSIVGVVFALALMVTEATAMASLADQWATGTGAERDMALAAGSALFELSLVFSVGGILFLFGTTPLLFGVAMLTGNDYSRWIGWVGMVFGSVALAAGTIQILTRQTTLTQFVLFPVAAIGITVWIIYLGVLLWQRSTRIGVEA